MTTIPNYVAWPLLATMAVIVVIRYRWFNTTRLEIYLNNAIALLLVANLFRDPWVERYLAREHLLSLTAAQQVSLVVAVFAAAEFLGFVGVATYPDRYLLEHHNWVRRGEAAAVAVLFIVATIPARRDGETVEQHHSWFTFAGFVLLSTYIILLASQMVRMVLIIRPFRGPKTP